MPQLARQSVGRIAPSLERSLTISTRPSSTDDLMRLGLMRQYGVPAELGIKNFPVASLRFDELESLVVPSNLDDQRSGNAFQVFNGDE